MLRQLFVPHRTATINTTYSLPRLRATVPRVCVRCRQKTTRYKKITKPKPEGARGWSYHAGRWLLPRACCSTRALSKKGERTRPPPWAPKSRRHRQMRRARKPPVRRWSASLAAVGGAAAAAAETTDRSIRGVVYPSHGRSSDGWWPLVSYRTASLGPTQPTGCAWGRRRRRRARNRRAARTGGAAAGRRKGRWCGRGRSSGRPSGRLWRVFETIVTTSCAGEGV